MSASNFPTTLRIWTTLSSLVRQRRSFGGVRIVAVAADDDAAARIVVLELQSSQARRIRRNNRLVLVLRPSLDETESPNRPINKMSNL